MNVTPQFISKVLKGEENLSLETIANFGKALDIKLIQIPSDVSVPSVFEFEQAYELSEVYRRQVFSKNAGKPVLVLNRKKAYRTERELKYPKSA